MSQLNMTKGWKCKLIHIDFVNSAVEVINPELKGLSVVVSFHGGK